MLGYLTKFVLQMLPTISATVIGAYIVATWINPKTPPAQAKIEARERAEMAKAAAVPPAQAQAKAGEKAGDDEAKAADPAEAGEPRKVASGPDNIRVIAIVKQPPSADDASVSEPAQAAGAEPHEGKDANELARAAIERLRGTTAAADAAATTATRHGHIREAHAAPVAAAASAPPLPPAVTIVSPSYPHDEAADQASAGLPEQPNPPVEFADARNPLSWQASHRVTGNPSFAEDFLSATRSFFRAITPPPLQDLAASSQTAPSQR